MGRTNVSYWADPSNYDRAWDTRAAQAAPIIGTAAWVCDLGCGAHQTLRGLLPPGAAYLPADVERWTPDTLVCDLNADDLPLPYLHACDVVVLLGVVEYVFDTLRLFKALAAHTERVLLTYSTTERHPARMDIWASALSQAELLQQLRSAGFRLEHESVVEEHRQVLIKAASTTFGPAEHARRSAARAALRPAL